VLDATPLRPSGPVDTPLSRHAGRLALSALVVCVAYIGAAWFARTFPFEGRLHDPYSESSVVRAMPFDTPMPYDVSLASAGRGDDLPYSTQWTSALPASDIEAQFREHLAGSPRWVITEDALVSEGFAGTIVRRGSDGYMTHFAHVAIESSGGQTIVTFDFTPIPTSLAPD
jgi:hypothetical protein